MNVIGAFHGGKHVVHLYDKLFQPYYNSKHSYIPTCLCFKLKNQRVQFQEWSGVSICNSNSLSHFTARNYFHKPSSTPTKL